MITDNSYKQDDDNELKDIVIQYIKKWELSDFLKVVSDALDDTEIIFYD